MHIILMLLVMIIGLAIGTNFSRWLGLPISAAGLLCLEMGSARWRERQESFFWFVGLVCGAIVLLSVLFE